MNEAVREMTFDEEYEILQKEVNKLYSTESLGNEPPFANCVVRRAVRCIRKLNEEIQQYRKLGTVEELREAKEKQISKTPDLEGDGYSDGHLVYDTWICPCCGEHYEVDYDDYDYCPKCGQHIDRSEME